MLEIQEIQMGQASSARGLRRTHIAVAVSLSLLGSSAAFAAEFKVVDGVIQFPNVVVVKAPQAAQATGAAQGGMRAYKDSATSELRGPTTEEMAAASRSTSAVSRRAATSDASASSDTSFALPGGGFGATVDESSLLYSVVVRQADGSLAEICVPADKAQEIVKNPSALKSKKENLHVR